MIEAFRTGARGIVYSNESLSQLADCIIHVYKGDVWVRGVDLGLILDGLLKPSVRVRMLPDERCSARERKRYPGWWLRG